MADHAVMGESNVYWKLINNEMCFIATKNIQKNEEILNNYGDITAWDACLNYGFFQESLKVFIDINIEESKLFSLSTQDISDPEKLIKITQEMFYYKLNHTTVNICEHLKSLINIYKDAISVMMDKGDKSCLSPILKLENKILKYAIVMLC